MTRPTIVGRCIYCGETERELTREHVIPFGISGKPAIILHQACCATCREKIHTVETYCLDKMMGPFRHRVEAPSRKRGGSKRPTHLPIQINHKDGRSNTITIPREHYPRVLHLPWLPLPSLALKKGPDDFKPTIWASYYEEDIKYHIDRYGGNGFNVGEFNTNHFARWLAKIAHGVVIHSMGPDVLSKYDFLLPRIILDEPKDMRMYMLVGAEPDLAPKASTPGHSTLIALARTREHEFIIAKIRLFAHHMPPTYHVIVAVRKREQSVV